MEDALGLALASAAASGDGFGRQPTDAVKIERLILINSGKHSVVFVLHKRSIKLTAIMTHVSVRKLKFFSIELDFKLVSTKLKVSTRS